MNFFVPHSEHYEKIAALYNAAIIPYFDIWTEEEKEYFGQSETAPSIAEQCAKRSVLAIRHKQNIAAYAIYRMKNSSCAWISSIFVHPDFQNQGYGAALLHKIEQEMRTQGANIIVLETHAQAHWAINFYLKHGYHDIVPSITELPFSTALDKPPVAGRALLGKIL